MAETFDWSISGADGQPIIGTTHRCESDARANVVITHGFKGYKEYGMIPRLASELTERCCVTTYRFNFSHSGMTNDVQTFARPDLFERNTWNKQVYDLHAVIRAIRARHISDARDCARPIVLAGHSRGGVACILAADRLTESQHVIGHGDIAAIITLAAPARCNPFTHDEAAALLANGWIESPSARTGQRLRIGRIFLQDQIDEPLKHDVINAVRRVSVPMLIVHGDQDTTVSADDAMTLAQAAGSGAIVKMIQGADHVFNTPNPMPNTMLTGEHLQQVMVACCEFIDRVVQASAGKVS